MFRLQLSPRHESRHLIQQERKTSPCSSIYLQGVRTTSLSSKEKKTKEKEVSYKYQTSGQMHGKWLSPRQNKALSQARTGAQRTSEPQRQNASAGSVRANDEARSERAREVTSPCQRSAVTGFCSTWTPSNTKVLPCQSPNPRNITWKSPNSLRIRPFFRSRGYEIRALLPLPPSLPLSTSIPSLYSMIW